MASPPVLSLPPYIVEAEAQVALEEVQKDNLCAYKITRLHTSGQRRIYIQVPGGWRALAKAKTRAMACARTDPDLALEADKDKAGSNSAPKQLAMEMTI